MNWDQGGTVIVRLPPDSNGKVVELIGDIESIRIERNEAQPIYTIGSEHSHFLPSTPSTSFTIRGVAREQKIIDPLKDKIIRPSRWSDIMDEDF